MAESELEDACKSVVAHLESVEGVRNVELAMRARASQGAILAWERANYPAQLPAELKAFFETCDGLSLTWSIDHMGEELRLGCLHVNELRQLARIHIDQAELQYGSVPSTQSSCGGGPVARGGANCPVQFLSMGASSGQGLMAFDLDSTAHDGRLCLLYKLPATDSPQVWFQDLSRSWSYVAESFGDYLRLLFVHLGLPRWQYAFTNVGLDPAAKHWLRLLAPRRLALHAAADGAGGSSHARTARLSGDVSPRKVITPRGAERAGDWGGIGRGTSKSGGRQFLLPAQPPVSMRTIQPR